MFNRQSCSEYSLRECFENEPPNVVDFRVGF